MTAIDILPVTAESTNALRARITSMGSKATTTRLAEALKVDREALKARLEADDTFATHHSVWHVTRYAPVGAVVTCAYWGYVYRVVSHNPDGSVTHEQIDHPRGNRSAFPEQVGRVWSHRTALDRRDEILDLPAVTR